MIDILQTICLGLIQGLTEFLPISSSAHLIFLPNLFGWPARSMAFDIATHLGTLTAVLFYYRQELRSMIVDSIQLKISTHSRLAFYLVAATIPVGIAGILAHDFINHHLRSNQVIGLSTIIFGIVLLIADRYNRQLPTTSNLTFFKTLLIGLSQTLALIPGASRSGVTLSAGLLVKLDRGNAANFSFLLSIPVIIMAGGLELYKLLFEDLSINLSECALGFSVAALSGYVCINLFLRLLKDIGLLPFVIYRLILGIVLLAYL